MIVSLMLLGLVAGFQNPYNLDLFADIMLEIGKEVTLDIESPGEGHWKLLAPRSAITIESHTGEYSGGRQYFKVCCCNCHPEQVIPFMLKDRPESVKRGLFRAVNYTINY